MVLLVLEWLQGLSAVSLDLRLKLTRGEDTLLKS